MSAAYERFVITATGPSVRGQVAGISGFVDGHGGYVEEFDQFDDLDRRRFFARAVFHVERSTSPGLEALKAGVADMAGRFGMHWSLHNAAARPRVLLMASKLDHCLRDLLYRHGRGELDMDVAAVVSNHRDVEPLVAGHGLRFVHLPVTPRTRGDQEAALWALIEETRSELVVLARYMQILSDELCRRLAGSAINIHHSFLPGFKGARPYRQAYMRGVKLIGATAHYVTPELDEGPIIEQAVERVDHTYTEGDLAAVGRNCECLALARAVKLHLDRRVFLNGERTVVFR
ncbi:formyltetrahydrofolate deformylase [Arhodomonas aquaeolei]|uniref:formyltetrahydrofolate deformylase n=1 Tax=Arhodomonas aquaeolei TaxID=2369 RepID=UPI00216913E0|nr:formyltetrahydrofolate deformylase [Arhodomonas aquaeolei]MCS4503370.1 formyltetrahydrofolate deformylase [Arhodomonas aquaeolei]